MKADKVGALALVVGVEDEFVLLVAEEVQCNMPDCILGSKPMDNQPDKVEEVLLALVVVVAVHSILFACKG